jgi:hypothetical protein
MSGCIAPRILHLGAGLVRGQRHIPTALLQVESVRYPLYGMVGGPRIRSVRHV